MAVFDFPYHRTRIQYPDDQSRVRFGYGFVFTAKPVFPVQRVFFLTMTGLQWFINDDETFDLLTEPTRNAKVFENFYLTHRLHTPFTYPAPGYGDVQVTFNRPLEMPLVEIGSAGMVPDFEVELLEQFS